MMDGGLVRNMYRVFNLKVDRQLSREYFTSDAIYNTDIQPKISIDEISLLWLFCGC